MQKEVKIDNRMQWILLLEEIERSGGKNIYYEEYEICSETRISGLLNYRNGFLLCSLLEEKNKQGDQRQALFSSNDK